MLSNLKILISSFVGAIVFYTIIPIPNNWQLDLDRVARWCPVIGVIIGCLLGLADWGLNWLGIPDLTRSALIIALWVGLTGGLHLDGAMDTGDGLAVFDPERRLEVMTDSVTGAFGAIALVLILSLKIMALSDINSHAWLALILATGWGRWGQVMAIYFYPYLKPTGKGAFHRQNFQFPQDLILGLLFLIPVSGLYYYLIPQLHLQYLIISIICPLIPLIIGFWLYKQLGGHTGDTYGAVVEWSEALILCSLTAFWK